MDPTRRQMIEEISTKFEELYGMLTSATHRAELGDMSDVAGKVYETRLEFATTMMFDEARRARD